MSNEPARLGPWRVLGARPARGLQRPRPAHPWVAGARPRTLPASAVPVLVGTAVAAAQAGAILWRAAVALLVSLAIQVGTNYANDYSDGIRGTDSARVGPVRLVASGIAPPQQVRRAAALAFLVAALGGLALAAVAGWWLLAVGAASIAAGWLYTGGPRPYGYAGLGELSVFVFFGVVATVGTAYVQTGRLTGLALAASVPVGLLSVALLVVNNLRDIPGDTLAGKRTLAVLIGRRRTRALYVCCVAGALAGGAAVAVSRPWALVSLAAAPCAAEPLRRVLKGAEGRDLVAALAGTGRLQLVFGALLAAGIWR